MKKGKQPLLVTHPEVAKEANGWDPAEFTSGMAIKKKWRCSKSHEWEASINSRVNGNGCPFCAGKKVIPGVTDLETTHPTIAAKANGWDPKLVSAGSGKRLAWKCKEGHFWEGYIYAEVKRDSNCAFCSGIKFISGINDLESTHPDIAREANGWDPKLVRPSAKTIKLWKCESGHLWNARIDNRVYKASTCPMCSGKGLAKPLKVKVMKVSFAKAFPKLASEANGWDPEAFSSRSGKNLSWICDKGHTWNASISNRTRPKSITQGCPICSGRKILSGFNDLQTKYPEIAAEAIGWDPKEIAPASNEKFQWQCTLGHVYEAMAASRTLKKTGCPICANQRVLTGFNDLATKFPEVAMQAFGWDPSLVMPGTEQVKSWKCSLGHIWNAMVYERTFKGSGCRICSGRELLIGYNDLFTRFPSIAAEAHGWDPRKVLSGHGKKKKWMCQNQHIWEAEVSVRTSSGSGCPSCGKYGFDSSKDGWLYFLENSHWEMFQIGITNDIERRISEHSRSGWELIEIKGPMDGHLLRQWETAILRMLKAKGADIANENIAGKFDGYSEAWCKSTFEVKSIKDLMNLTEEYEESD
jgi:hypothetical protein